MYHRFMLKLCCSFKSTFKKKLPNALLTLTSSLHVTDETILMVNYTASPSINIGSSFNY